MTPTREIYKGLYTISAILEYKLACQIYLVFLSKKLNNS